MRRPGYLAGIDESIPILVRQAARWSTAANQDQNPMIALLHANYGAGYLWALQDIATHDEIEKIGGIKWKKFRREILKAQDNAAQKLAQVCPNFAPKKSYLTKIAKEG
jgi:hypothetical protein